MDSMSLLGYLLIFLLISVGNALAYTRLKEWKARRDKELDQKLADTEEKYKELMVQVKEARAGEARLRGELAELKKTVARSESRKKESSSSKQTDFKNPVQLLEEKGVLTREKVAKARNYVERSDNPGLTLEDALVLLGLVSCEQLKKARQESGGQR
ncbi:hypothetical protein [Desulfonatronovibrio hydrogenovorans]|uniref:hypothetical protein n=1 Tax=Desulfonatronovibrio hydrogenovorans TaxID=53245 RepID=UPI0004907294|nr:hypothetical protein [Desulfonatronovibrio hydrogenovorans]